MTSRFKLVLGVLALAAFAALPAAGLAAGGSTIRNVQCPMYDGYGVKFTGVGTTSVSSDGLKAKLVCKATNVPTPSKSTIYWSYANTGHGCQVIGKDTLDWLESVTSRGTAQLTCNLVVQ
jgi:hypothetical protein